ncbi:MAG: DegV family protein [Lachnospira eligens]
MVKIISDSTSDLTKELIDKFDISVIPLHILLGNDEYRDGIDKPTPDKIYKWADENKTAHLNLSAVSIDDTIEMFKCVLEEDRDIVAFAISEDISASD